MPLQPLFFIVAFIVAYIYLSDTKFVKKHRQTILIWFGMLLFIYVSFFFVIPLILNPSNCGATFGTCYWENG